MSKRWNSDPAVSGGGVLIDNGTHSVDIIRYFLGPIAEVLAVEGKRVQTLAVEDTVQMFVRAASGARGTIDLSWSLDKERDSYIEIYGSNGTVRVGWKESKFRAGHQSRLGGVRVGLRQGRRACGRRWKTSVAALRGQEPLLITVEDAHCVGGSDRTGLSFARQLDGWVRVGDGEMRRSLAGRGRQGGGVSVQVHPTAIVEKDVEIGPGTSVWSHVHIRGPARVGAIASSVRRPTSPTTSASATA